MYEYDASEKLEQQRVEKVERSRSISLRVPQQLTFTLLAFFGYFCVGSSLNMWGPCWPDLQRTLLLTAHEMKYGLTVRYVGYAGGNVAFPFTITTTWLTIRD